MGRGGYKSVTPFPNMSGSVFNLLPLWSLLTYSFASICPNCNISHSRANSDDDWKLVSSDKDMKVYIREVEEDGAICDPVKAVTTVQVDHHKNALVL